MSIVRNIVACPYSCIAGLGPQMLNAWGWTVAYSSIVLVLRTCFATFGIQTSSGLRRGSFYHPFQIRSSGEHVAPGGDLIHVVPETFYAQFNVVFKMLLPLARFCICEVGEMAPSRPNLSWIFLSIRILLKMPHSFPIRTVHNHLQFWFPDRTSPPPQIHAL